MERKVRCQNVSKKIFKQYFLYMLINSLIFAFFISITYSTAFLCSMVIGTFSLPLPLLFLSEKHIDLENVERVKLFNLINIICAIQCLIFCLALYITAQIRIDYEIYSLFIEVIVMLHIGSFMLTTTVYSFLNYPENNITKQFSTSIALSVVMEIIFAICLLMTKKFV